MKNILKTIHSIMSIFVNGSSIGNEREWMNSNKQFKYRLCEEARHYSTNLNKNILFIATGAISVSILFVTSSDNIIRSDVLLLSWFYFVACMFLCCLEFVFMKSSIKNSLDATDIIIASNDETVESQNKDFWAEVKICFSEWAVNIAIILLFFGIISLLYFSYANLNS